MGTEVPKVLSGNTNNSDCLTFFDLHTHFCGVYLAPNGSDPVHHTNWEVKDRSAKVLVTNDCSTVQPD